MSLPMDFAMRRVKPGLPAITVALLSLTPASQAATLLAGSPTTVGPVVSAVIRLGRPLKRPEP